MNQEIPCCGKFIEMTEIEMRQIGEALQNGTLKIKKAIQLYHTSIDTIKTRLSLLDPPIILNLKQGRPEKYVEKATMKSIKEYSEKTKVGYQQCAFALNLSEWDVRKVYELLGLFVYEQEFLTEDNEHPNLFVAKYVGQLWHTDIHYIKYKENNEEKIVYLIGFIDDRSRYIVHYEILDTKNSNAAAQSLLNALQKAPKPHMITIDNGGEFIGKPFQDVLKEYGIEDHRTHPYTPQENGKIERWWLTIETHLISIDHLDFIVNEYNNRWMHRGLKKIFNKKLTPATVYNNEERWEGHDDIGLVYLNT